MIDRTHHKIHDAIHVRPQPSYRISAHLDENWPFANFSLVVYAALQSLEVRQALQERSGNDDDLLNFK